jgi:hypothetical protein
VLSESKFKTCRVEITSTCKNIRALGEQLKELEAMNEIKYGFEGEILLKAKKLLKGCCAGCVVPSGIFKTLQVASGLALPQEISIKIEKKD